MEYLSVRQTAEKWGISTKRIQFICIGICEAYRLFKQSLGFFRVIELEVEKDRYLLRGGRCVLVDHKSTGLCGRGPVDRAHRIPGLVFPDPGKRKRVGKQSSSLNDIAESDRKKCPKIRKRNQFRKDRDAGIIIKGTCDLLHQKNIRGREIYTDE